MATEEGNHMSDGIDIQLGTLKITGDPTKLYEELAKAQAEFTPVPKKKDGQSGFSKFKYAGYSTVMRCVRPALSAHGIAVLQPLHYENDKAVTTIVLAGHGASISSSFMFNADFRKKQKDGSMAEDPQEFGRCHTYYRRYQLQAMLGLEGDADADDLPDVNEESSQYSEPEPQPAKVASSPKASVEKKSAPVEKPTLPSAPVSGATTSAKPTEAPAQSTKTVHELIAAGMKELKWKIDDVKSFYKLHVDKSGFDNAANLTLEQKTELFKKMVEVNGVTPF